MSAGRAIVLVDHGSRRAEANAVVEEVAAALRERLGGAVVEVAHLELAPPDVGEAVARCVARGAAEVLVQPFFLAPGRHGASDLAALAAAAAARHPGVSVRVGEPLGAHPRVVDAVLDRISGARGPSRTE